MKGFLYDVRKDVFIKYNDSYWASTLDGEITIFGVEEKHFNDWYLEHIDNLYIGYKREFYINNVTFVGAYIKAMNDSYVVVGFDYCIVGKGRFKDKFREYRINNILQ